MESPETPKSEFAVREEEILAFWRANDIFKKSVEKDSPKGEYVFYDGPPFATGLPHYGHIVASVMKDAIPRYFTMRGYSVPRVWGWDCHGLPIENIVEKELGFKHKKEIVEMGVAKFNERCREQVLTYASEWEKVIPRIGRWVDMEHPYRTMDKPFMESVWWVFKQLWDKGLVYEDYRSMHVCPHCETTLSQQEVSEGYKDVKDISVTVKFKVKNPEKHGLPDNTFILAWTTTPWTLPGNVALAVNPKETYRVFNSEGENYIDVKKDSYTYPGNDIKLFLGKEIVGVEYEPLFDYYAKDTTLKNRENGWKIVAGDFVTTDTGTGVVHIAPAFGEDDMELGKKENLPFIQHVAMDGTMRPEVSAFAGMEVKPRSDDDKERLSTDIAILKYLQEHNHFFSKENITHPYPHCWRCDTPLLNYATSSWFVAVTKLKASLIENAKAINWSPEHIKEGRFGKWLEGARDWSISRQRFWASVIPLWVCADCKAQRVFGSAAELEAESGKKVDDLHKHIVDEITVPCECGGTMSRIPDVLDTWFDSGSMPYGEKHYPFESKERFENTFPAQFIAEGLDQTRAWFYYLHVLGGALFGKNAFQNVIVNGIVLAEDGKKMSKKLKNYPDPMEVVNKYGADALRFYLLASPVMQAENLSFSEKGVDEVVKKNLGRLNNVLAFYKLYDNGTVRDWKSEHVLDRWILSRLEEVVTEVTLGFDAYRLDAAMRPISGFIDDLSVWYLRRSRDRFKIESDDKNAALATMRYVLHRFSRLLAPAMPFYAEHLFLVVRESEDEESVHLAAWPGMEKESPIDAKLVKTMEMARGVVTLALEARSKAGIPVRQPLSKLEIAQAHLFADAVLDIIREEVNVKSVLGNDALTEGVLLDLVLTESLREEGLVRDLIRAIQQSRKDANLTPGQKAVASIANADAALQGAAEKYRNEIMATTGLSAFSFAEGTGEIKITLS